MNIDVVKQFTVGGNTLVTSLEYRSRMAIYLCHDHPKAGHARDIERMNLCWWIAHCPRRRNTIQRHRYWLNQAARYARRATDFKAAAAWHEAHRRARNCGPYPLMGSARHQMFVNRGITTNQ